MNIMFVWDSPGVGGVQTVTEFLANRFVKDSHNVTVLFLWGGDPKYATNFDKSVDIRYGECKKISTRNIDLTSQLVKEKGIDVIINQMGGNVYFARTLYKATKGLNTKIIAVYHNAPDYNTRLHRATLKLENAKSACTKTLFTLKRTVVKKATSRMMRYSYDHSDYFMLLSESFIPSFSQFTNIKTPHKILVINNPTTIKRDDVTTNIRKEKLIIYVGRLEESQKRFSRVLRIWKAVSPLIPDWHLSIVGDGPDRSEYEEYVRTNNLGNIVFEGFRKPVEFYERASILLLTSDYEGWGLVLCEGMCYGCVPVVLASYKSCYEIVENNRNGIIMEMPFCVEEWKETIVRLTNSPTQLKELSDNAIQDSKRFDIETIYKQWITILNKILR